MGILLGGRGGCEAPPLLLLSLSLVVGRGRGSCASQEEPVTPCPFFEGRKCHRARLMGWLGKEIRLHRRNLDKIVKRPRFYSEEGATMVFVKIVSVGGG